MADNGTEVWVPITYNGGVTIGKGKISADMTTLEIVLNEGSDVGQHIADGLTGFSVYNRIVNDAVPEITITDEKEIN